MTKATSVSEIEKIYRSRRCTGSLNSSSQLFLTPAPRKPYPPFLDNLNPLFLEGALATEGPVG